MAGYAVLSNQNKGLDGTFNRHKKLTTQN